MDLLRHYWTKLQTSLLLIPLVMAALAMALAFALLDMRVATMLGLPPWLQSADAAATRDLLNALLNGIITMLSLVMSLTMVVLTLAAAQIGSRLIRSFIDDSVTQTVLGLFLATLIYLVVVVRAIDGPAAGDLPDVAIATSIGLSLLCVVALFVYVDRLSRAIVFDHAASRIAEELSESCDQLRDETEMHRRHAADASDGRSDDEIVAAARADRAPALALGEAGYVQSVSWARLLDIARRADCRIVLHVRPGQWINAESPCIAIVPPAPPALARQVLRQLIVGWVRTPTQDIEYGLQRLVEMAVRALSPGINDVFTALAAIDNVGASVARIFAMPGLPRVLRDRDGVVRVIRPVIDAEGIVAAAFDQIRESGARMPAVAIRLLEALARLAPAIRSDEQHAAVLAQIDAVFVSTRSHPMIERDAEAVAARYRHARSAIGAGSGDRQ